MVVARRLIPAVVLALFYSATASTLRAQDVGSIRGVARDSASQQPLTNVNIIVEGTQRGAIARVDGSFDISGVPAGARIIRARRIGYHSMSVPVTVPAGGTATVTLDMAPQPTVLTEIVATGYGTQRREAITASIATVDVEAAKVGVVTNATQLMQGRTPGVQIVQSNGEPGGNTQIRIRGGTSLSASNDPLFVIDGVAVQNDAQAPGAAGVINGAASLARNPLNSINPDDIETITILKDAAATAIYGSRAANGVVLITTKRGGRVAQIEYETYVGSSMPRKTLGLANGAEYRAFVTQWQDSLGKIDPLTGINTAVQNLGDANTDWENAVTKQSLSMNHNVAFSGGSEQTKYRASLNYFDRDGVVINTGLKRYQGRLNATHDALNGRVRLGLNLMASRVQNYYAPNENTAGFLGGLFTNMVIYNPTYPVDCAGNLKPCGSAQQVFYESGPNGVYNPVALLYQITDRAPEDRLLGNFTGTVQLLEGLTAQSTLGADNTGSVRRTYIPRLSPAGAQLGNGYARQVDRNLQNVTFNQLLTWTPRFAANHEVEVVGGYEYTKYDNHEFGAATTGFVSDAFGPDNLVAGTANYTGYPYSWRTESKLASFFSRMNYGYAGKYFLTGVLRRDGSSRLAPGHRWETFPALSGSWRLSEESFMRDFRPFNLSMLALRAGWGKQGNQSINPYQTKLLLRADPASLYPFGGVITSGLRAAQVGNPDLKWETATQTNVGLDFGLNNDRVTGAIEVYQKNTKDLLQEVPVPQPAVVPTQLKNIGSIRNRGLEANVEMPFFSGARSSVTGGLVLTVERNKVTNLGDTTAACRGEAVTKSFAAYSSAGCLYYQSGFVNGQGQSNQWSQVIMRGQPVGSFLAPQFIGVATSYNIDNSGATPDTIWSPGSQLFACSAGSADCYSGQTINPVDADRIFAGTANPSFTLGLHNNVTWNSFDASWLWRGEFGGKVFNNTALVFRTKSAFKQGRNLLRGAIDDPDNISEPAKYSTRWLEDRTFVRLQNLTFGYTLPKTLMGGRSTRVYVSGDNLALFTKYSGYDPEVFTSTGLASRGVDYLTFPPTRNFTVGARTQF